MWIYFLTFVCYFSFKKSPWNSWILKLFDVPSSSFFPLLIQTRWILIKKVDGTFEYIEERLLEFEREPVIELLEFWVYYLKFLSSFFKDIRTKASLSKYLKIKKRKFEFLMWWLFILLHILHKIYFKFLTDGIRRPLYWIVLGSCLQMVLPVTEHRLTKINATNRQRLIRFAFCFSTIACFANVISEFWIFHIRELFEQHLPRKHSTLLLRRVYITW